MGSNPDFPAQVERLAAQRYDLVAAFSPNGNIVASAGNDGVVTLWNLRREGRPRVLGTPIVGHAVPYREQIYALAMTPDATLIATAGQDSTVELWDTTDPARPRLLGTPITEHRDGSSEGVGEIALRHGPVDRVLRRRQDPHRGSYRRTVVWDVRDPEHPRRRAAVLEDENIVGIWRVRNGRVLALVQGSGQYATSSGLPAPTTETTGDVPGIAEGGGGTSQGGPGDPNGSRLWTSPIPLTRAHWARG